MPPDDPSLWIGTYSGTGHGLHSIELRPDGTYRSVVWQQLMAASGCGGPFVGDGLSEGVWSTGLRHVTFDVERESSQFKAPLEGARLVSEGGTFELRLADERSLAMTWAQR